MTMHARADVGAIELKDDGEGSPDLSVITKQLAELTTKVNERLSAVETKSADGAKVGDRLDKIEAKLARPGIITKSQDDADAATIERKAIADFVRTGSDVEIKSNFVGSDPAGGYLVMPTLESGIRTIARDVSPLRALASSVAISTDSYEILVDTSDVTSGWVGETDERPETESPSLRKVTIPVHEGYAAPRVTQRLLDDANLDVGAWLEGKIGDHFARTEGVAFATGSGSDRPKGFLTYETAAVADFTRDWGKWQHVAAGHASNPTDKNLADALVRLSLTLRVPYRSNATWLMSRETAVRIRQIKDTTDHFIWQPGLQDGQPDRLLGFPVSYDDQMPGIGADTLPIALADWKQAYAIVDRHGVRFIRDQTSVKPHTIFYCYRRVGGGAVDFNALKFLKISAA